ncbi:MAG TPA: ABC transporter permease, partial [Fervidobacterium sp.]|nr:ABC transporter permease [Fervidobacterium sp.]
MNFVKKYLLPRLITYFLVFFIGITMVFFIPRLLPTDPVQRTVTRVRAMGAYLDPEATEKMMESLEDLYGLKGSVWEQY